MEFKLNENLKVVAASIIAVIFSIIFIGVVASVGRSCNIEIFNNLVVVYSLLEIFILIGQIIILKIFGTDKSLLNDVGLKNTEHIFRNIVKGIMMVILYDLLFCYIMCTMNTLFYYGVGYNSTTASFLNPIIFKGFILSILAAICEEIFFRGILCNYLRRLKGSVFAVVVSSLIFSAAHITGYNNIQNLIIIFLYGLALGHFYIRTKSLYLSMAIHFTIDFAQCLIGIGSVGFFTFMNGPKLTSSLFNNTAFFANSFSFFAFAIFIYIFEKATQKTENKN